MTTTAEGDGTQNYLGAIGGSNSGPAVGARTGLATGTISVARMVEFPTSLEPNEWSEEDMERWYNPYR